MSGFSLRNMPRKRRVGIGLVAFFLVAAPSLFFLSRAFNHESLQEATAALNAALAARDMEQLNRYIDFNMLSLGFADAILEVKNSDKRDGDERRAISEAVQKELLAAFRSEASGESEKEQAASPEQEEGAAGKEEAEGSKDLPKEVRAAIAKALQRERAKKAAAQGWDDATSKPVPLEQRPAFLPDDFVWQLAHSPFYVTGGDDSLGLLTTTVRHGDAGYETPIRLAMHNTSNGWRVIGVANARELVRTHDKALDTWRERVVTGFRAENRRRLDIMHKHYQVLSCKAFLAKNLGAESDVPLVITLEGVNIGRYKLMSAGMSCMLYGQDGSLAASVPLNTTKIVEPGDPFSQLWQLELPRDLEQTRRLLAEPSLSCSVKLSAVSLSNGRMIHERPQSDLDKLLR